MKKADFNKTLSQILFVYQSGDSSSPVTRNDGFSRYIHLWAFELLATHTPQSGWIHEHSSGDDHHATHTHEHRAAQVLTQALYAEGGLDGHNWVHALTEPPGQPAVAEGFMELEPNFNEGY